MLRASSPHLLRNQMVFDLAKAIVYRHERSGKRLRLSPAVLAFVNERIDRQTGQRIERKAAMGVPDDAGNGW